MRFLFIISHDDAFAPTPQLIAEIGTWTKKRRAEGVLIDSNPLKPASEATTVRVRNKQTQRKPGPFSRSREQMCAYVLIEAKNHEEAVSIASSHPMASAATIEVRPVWQDLR
ncbi:MAG: YciI family protein [Nibricoccus sp.]